MNPAAPTMVILMTAIPQPIKCLRYSSILQRILPKIAVVTIDPPLNMRKVEPDIKTNATNCKIDIKTVDPPANPCGDMF